MMTTSEKAIQKSMTRPRLSVHHTSFFLWELCHELVRSTTQRFPVCSGAGLPFSEISYRIRIYTSEHERETRFRRIRVHQAGERGYAAKGERCGVAQPLA